MVFEDSPLDEVVCQIRFNDILTIGEGPPAKLQDRLRRDFPIFGSEQGVQFGVSPMQSLSVLASPAPTWQFKSADEAWITSVTTNFIALKTTTYSDFPDFWSRLRSVLEAFENIYSPPFYTRVGLRYVNRIVIPRDGDQPVEWSSILNPRIAGEYSDPDLRGLVTESKHHAILEQPRGFVGWRYSRDVGEMDGNNAERFTLDFDHFVVGQLPLGDIPALLADFNEALYRLFVWCLTPEGIKLLKPRPKAAARAEGR
jgi:uncharacterized protein (TIGR04255 family)